MSALKCRESSHNIKLTEGILLLCPYITMTDGSLSCVRMRVIFKITVLL
jgi:hypothetical protein